MRFRGLILLLPMLLGVRLSQASSSIDYLEITFADVGQGDSIMVSNGAGFEILVDGGRKSAGETLLNYLRENEISELEVIVATHADSDHIGGLIDVIEAEDISIGKVYYNGYPGITDTWNEFLDALADEGKSLVSAHYPQSYAWGGIQFEVLNPISGLVDPDQNEASIVLAVKYNQMDVLLTADIDAGVEMMLPTRSPDLDSEILKVAHHGSQYSTSDLLLQEVNPEQAIISVGTNPYGHPALEVLSRLTSIGAHVWRTDQLGTIRVISDGVRYEIFPKLVYLPLSFKPTFNP